MAKTMLSEQEILSGVNATVGLIIMLQKALEETKRKYADKPSYLALSVRQTQRQIQKMIDGIQSLLGVRSGDALPFSIRLHGDENPDGLVRIDSLKNYLKLLGSAVKEASHGVDPSISPGDYLIGAANIGSFCVSIIPDARTGKNGVEVLSRLGSAIQEISSLKSKRTAVKELSPLARKVYQLMPRKILHIDKAEFHGTSMSKGPILFERGELKARRPRVKKEMTPEFPILGQVVAVDGEKRTAFLGGDPRTKFHYSESQAGDIMARFMKGPVSVVLVGVGNRKNLVRFDG